jgi:hypothetical protein
MNYLANRASLEAKLGDYLERACEAGGTAVLRTGCRKATHKRCP